MTGAPRSGPTDRLVPATLLVAVGLLILLAGGAATARASPPTSSTTYASLSWTNGEVLCVTDASQPSATVTASGNAGAGLTMGLGNLTQQNLVGVAAASADLAAASWDAVNVSDEGEYGVTYSASVPVLETAVLGVVGLQIGTVSVAVTISMDDYAPSAHPPADAYEVSLAMNISGWPWAAVGSGPLVANLTVAPAAPDVVHLTAGTGNATVTAVNGSGQPMAYLAMGAAANVTSPHGVTSSVDVVGSLLALAGSAALVEVNFTSAATGASEMNYTSNAVVEPDAVEIPPTINIPGAPPIPTVDFLAVGGAAVLLSLAIAGGTRRVRRSSSNLEYVTEEEER